MHADLPITEQSDEQVMETVRQLQVAYKLKRTLRYTATRDLETHNESVAEHVFAMFFLAQYFLPLEDPEGTLNIEKVYHMILFHDFGEIIGGDISYPQKTQAHEEQERKDAQIVFDSLPSVLQHTASEAWHAYEQQAEPEARFVYALDRIEPLFELLDPVSERSLKRLKISYQTHVEKKLRATENFPVMRKFVDVICRDMLKRKVFWEEQPE